MKSKLMKRILILLAVTIICNVMQAQVTIGSLLNPQKGALLDLKEEDPINQSDPNSEKGILFPKVALIDVKSLEPLIKGMAVAADSMKMRGMIVYNVNENANGIDAGLSVWNGEEWMSIVGGGASKAAVFTIDWTKVTINGTYVKDKPLTYGNTVSLPVNVTRAGTYNLVAYSKPDNNYYFSVKGEFMAKGTYTLLLNAMGRPKEATADRNGTEDVLEFYNNNQPLGQQGSAPISLFVDAIAPEYTCNCATINTNNAVLKTKQKSTGYIILDITSPSGAAGAPFNITTNTVNGIQFSATGILQGGSQKVYLDVNGAIPPSSGIYSFTITTNSTAPNATSCSFNVPVAGRIVKVLTVSASGNRALGTNSGAYALLKNKALFGPNSAYCSAEDIDITNQNTLPAALSIYDIVVVSHDIKANAAQRQNLITFAKTGGVVIYCADQTTGCDLLNTYFNVTGFTATDNGGSWGGTYPVSTNNGPIVKGAYANLTGKHLGFDGGWNFYTSVPQAQKSKVEVIATNGNADRVIMLRILDAPIIVCGDGGPFTGKTGTDSDEFPLIVDSKDFPDVKTNGTYSQGAYNAHLFTNIMIWAVNQRLQTNP
jgi:hypothetical protein